MGGRMIIGIVCEYNPFHNGHLYHIEKIREEFGEDVNIIAVMSGNYVQRGGVAIADKGLRARCAVESGVNLVLELPFPFSMSSAEYFAKSAIHILDSIGCVDFVSFGSESGSLDELTNVADFMLSKDFKIELERLTSDVDTKKRGHAALCAIALKNLLGTDAHIPSLTPNNILAIEYIKAIISSKSSLKIHTVKRANNAFSDEEIVPGNIQSATAIRKSINNKDISALEYTPDFTKCIILDAISTGDFPCENEKLSTAIISSLRLNLPSSYESIHDTSGGLYNRLRELSFKTNTIDSLICAAESKNFTKARIRRTLFYSLLGVTSSQFNELPAYTQLLAFDSRGRAMLKTIGKRSCFPILTKPSDLERLPENALPQKMLSDRADTIFQLTKPIPKDGHSDLRYTPYVKK
jgi:predicted nucleotidyltransferase